MTVVTDDRRHVRVVGALLGAACGPSAGFGAAWSGIADGRLHVWVLAILGGALLGAVAWPVFADDAGGARRPGSGFAALFGFSVGLLAGGFAGFPMGAIFGAMGGAIGAAAAAFFLRREDTLGGWMWPVATAMSLGTGFFALYAWAG